MPNFPANVRLANPTDLYRLGLVHYAANFTEDDEVQSTDIQDDAIRQDAHTIKVAMEERHALVLVVSARFDLNERDSDKVRLNNEHAAMSVSPPLTSNSEGIVGFIVFSIDQSKLKPDPTQQEPDSWAFHDGLSVTWPDLKKRTSTRNQVCEKFSRAEGTMYVNYLMIHPAYQRQGHGKTLLTICKEVAHRYSVARIDLFSLDANSTAFYEKHGFQPEIGFEDENGGEMSYWDTSVQVDQAEQSEDED